MRWMTWEGAWRDALYGAAGFYRRPEGPAGHFATATQGQGGAVLAEAIAALAQRHRLHRILDLGAGRGELIRALSKITDLALVGVEVVARPDGLPSDVGWLRSPGGRQLPALSGLEDTLVVAHEWLDVVPCPVAQRDPHGIWRVVEVEVGSGAERLGSPLGPADRAWVDRHLPSTARRVEVGRARDLAFADLCGRVRSGIVLAVDYGHIAGDRPVDGTLIGFRTGRAVPPLPDGTCDLTAHVAMDTLGAHLLVRQREALTDLLGTTTPPSPQPAGADPAAYLQAVARTSAAAALKGMGGFWWTLQGRGRVRLD